MTDKEDDIYCLIVPMLYKPMLIPNQALAEIVPYIDSEPPPEEHESWHIGYLHWRGMLLPVISYEEMYGEKVPESQQRVKMIAILHTQLGLKNMPYFGVAVQGIPRLAPVSRETIEHQDPKAIEDLPEPILARVNYRERELIIPDVKHVEWLIDKHVNN